MAKTTATSVLSVRDPKSGKVVVVRGAGALKGAAALKIKKGVDLTKPIASQTLKSEGRRKSAQG